MKSIIILAAAMLSLVSCDVYRFPAKYSEKEVIELYGNKKDGSKFLNIDGKKVHYRISGTGPDMVLVHGTIDSLHTWDLILPELEKNFRVIRFDVPGFGLSDPINLDGDMVVSSAKYMDRIFNELSLSKFHLVGNSLGGLLAWYYAAKYPHRVDKLVLFDAAAYPQEFPWVFDGTNPVYRSVILTFGGIGVEPVVKAFGRYIPGLLGEINHPEFVDSQLERVGKLFQSEGNIESYAELLKKEGEYDFSHHVEIKNIKSDILILYGEKDGIIPPNIQVPLWKKDRPNDKIVILKEGGHLLHWERPKRTVELINEFIGVN